MFSPRLLLSISFLGTTCAAPGEVVGDLEIPAAETKTILADPQLNESSGLARSIRHPGVFWTLNDSGGEPCVYALDRDGRTRAKVRLRDAVNLDWEDLAIHQGKDGRARLYIADIGDNLGMRPSVQIYIIPEPDLPKDAAEPLTETWSEKPRVLHVAYPEKPMNAEGLTVLPDSGDVLITTKSDSGKTCVFSLPVDAEDQSTTMLKLEATLTFPKEPRLGKRPRDNTMATGADVSPDGKRLLISTYSHIYEWKISGLKSLAKDLAAQPTKIQPTVTRQMEAVCYEDDSHTIWFTSEQLPAPMIRIERKR